MNADFSRTLSLLRQERGLSQRKVAKELGISQALLSHYENGIREPGLAFVVKACDYFHVSADYLLGRTLDQEGCMIDLGVQFDVIGKSGAWFSYNGEKVAQGREKMRIYLKENPEVAKEIEAKIRAAGKK